MTKKILLTLSIFCFIGATVFGQAIEGGAGIIHVTGDPNDNLLLNTVTENEGNIAYDDVNQTAYFYNPGGTAYDGVTTGTRWTALDISGLVDPITSILVDIAGSPELTAVTVGGTTTLSFESDATITYIPATNVLTFTDVDGDNTTVDLSDLSTPVSAADPSITITNVGTAANPDYEVGVTGSAVGGNNGFVPVTDGAGNLTWTNVVQDVTVSTDGQVMLTFTDSATPVAIDMSNIPEAANITELNGFATALGVGETGLVRASDDNTFGMPATSTVGVLFFISN
jgi:hypothetical protein